MTTKKEQRDGGAQDAQPRPLGGGRAGTQSREPRGRTRIPKNEAAGTPSPGTRKGVGGASGGLVNRHRERERSAPKLGQSQRVAVTADGTKSARDTAAQGRGLRGSHPHIRDPGLQKLRPRAAL